MMTLGGYQRCAATTASKDALDVSTVIESVQLDNQLQHCSLNFIVTACTVVESGATLRKVSQTHQREWTALTKESTSSKKMIQAFLLLAISYSPISSTHKRSTSAETHKQGSHHPRALSNVFLHQFRSNDSNERRFGSVGDCSCAEGLSCSGRA
jgi:hypothetical protein